MTHRPFLHSAFQPRYVLEPGFGHARRFDVSCRNKLVRIIAQAESTIRSSQEPGGAGNEARGGGGLERQTELSRTWHLVRFVLGQSFKA
jgi:hypothetical protein